MNTAKNAVNTNSKALNPLESSQILNKCRQLILTYNFEKANIQRIIDINSTKEIDSTEEKDILVNLQNKFVITIFGVTELLTDSDRQKLIEILDAFELNNEINVITERIKRYIKEENIV